MPIHICEICYKTFKTKQHLNQHKNKKTKCTHHVDTTIGFEKNNIVINGNTEMPTPTKEFISSEPSTPTKEFISSEPSTPTINAFDNNVHPDINKNNIANCNDKDDNISLNYSDTSENIKNDISVENLSVANLLEFVNTHKKILSEKNKLESTLILLKKHIDDLSRENFELKNKISIVNSFVSDYKNTQNNYTSHKKKSNSAQF